jgi:hypothetical protein
MKTFSIAVIALFVTVSLSALNPGNRIAPPAEDGYSSNYQDTTKKKKDKKKKDTTEKKDTAFAQYHH